MAVEIPFPAVCADCPHEECHALAAAWRLLMDDYAKHPPYIPEPQMRARWFR